MELSLFSANTRKAFVLSSERNPPFMTAVTKAAARGTISGADRTGPRPLLQNRAPTLRTFPITKRELSLAG